ncbi:MAG: alpha-amylase family protein, partial [Candidatus Dormibacteraeota bacterium]|nr:alpha-amylase family protein [Candidatus Dormibacteraeota bacterium]
MSLEELGSLGSTLEAQAANSLEPREAWAFLARTEYHFPDAQRALSQLYGRDHDLEQLWGSLFRIMLDAAAARPEGLRKLDHRREMAPDWFQREPSVGYVCYADRFAGTLAGVERHLDYLQELRVTHLHLMPLLHPRPAPNDGGYAVMDYRAVDPKLGSMGDLQHLTRELRGRGISICIDVVLNHTAREHLWARRALDGDGHYRDFYLTFPDRSLPDAYERTLIDVFPSFAPGSFSWVPELDAWVWTTFNEYQWDLNYANPDVFAEMLDTMLYLANMGVEILRLDAVPFMWKRLGTDCQNQPEVHLLLQSFRALVRIVAPAVAFKAEAIVPHQHLVRYLGGGDWERTECDLAYHNQLMVQLWSSLASRDVALMTHALASMPSPPPRTSWVTYARCHDDIGWAVSDTDAAGVGVDGWSHRNFLNQFYAGRFAGSFARGELFQENAATGDARISGTAASLCGLEQAIELGDSALVEQAIRRLVLAYSVVFSYGGVPLIYMGDELALRNDRSYQEDPALADDNRWMHRPLMDWQAAARRGLPDTVENRVFSGFCRLIEAKRHLPALHAAGSVTPLWTDNRRIFAYRR